MSTAGAAVLRCIGCSAHSTVLTAQPKQRCRLPLHVPHHTQRGAPPWEAGDVDALDDADSDDEEEEEARMFSSQLSSLTLQAPPGIPPISIFDHAAGTPLQLQRYPRLQHLVLSGPIVCEAGHPPFFLPDDTKITIDHGLGDRPKTGYARTPVSYRRFAEMPRDAVLNWDEYKWEDSITHEERMVAWVKELIAEGIRVKNEMGLELPNCGIEGFFSGSCLGRGSAERPLPAGAENILMIHNPEIEGRWDLITPAFTRIIAARLLEDYELFERDPVALLGFNPFEDE